MEEIACARYDVMEALSDIKRVLVRAKFHTDQIEGMLNRVLVQKINFSIDEAQTFDKVATSIEICACPKGYTGYSCENCDYGYRKSSLDSWLNECIKCDCNGHSPGCETDGTCYVSFKSKTKVGNLLQQQVFFRLVSIIRPEVTVKLALKGYTVTLERKIPTLANFAHVLCRFLLIILALLALQLKAVTFVQTVPSGMKARFVRGKLPGVHFGKSLHY